MKNKRKIFKALDVVVGFAAISSIFVLLNATGAYAESSVVDTVTITVPASCSITNTINTAHTAAINVGTYEDEIGETTFKVLCNDANGFSVYAIGFSDDAYGNTTMKPTSTPASNGIATGTATSGDTSNWAMKLTSVSNDYTPTITTGYNAYHAVPDEYTKVATFTSNTDATSGSSFKSTYAAFISQAQAADTYVGKVKYTIIHPADAATPITPDAIMQNMDPSECTSTPINVIDNRDDHIYVAQRLADGNCWMMENLDLGRTDLTTDLTSANTNLSSSITAATFNSWKKDNRLTPTYDAGEFIPLTTSNTANGLDTDPTSNTPYGTLYNFYAASAGTISGTGSTSIAQYDICPAGWRLPTGGSTGEFGALYTRYSSAALIRAPITDNGAAFALSGFSGYNLPEYQGVYGRYWSSTGYNNTSHMYILDISTSSVTRTATIMRSYGQAIRCILNEPKTISKLTYLQDFNYLSAADKATVAESMEDNTLYNLIDNRDNRTYAISKLADGNIWMAENLDLGRTSLTANLTSANTNLTTTVTAATFNGWKVSSGTQTYTTGEYAPVSGTDASTTFSYGSVYNYCAASAGTICTSSNTKNATSDLCPAGWRMPTGGASGELKNLYDNYYTSASSLRTYVPYGGAGFSLSGYMGTGEPGGMGTMSYYWSSTYGNGTPVMYTMGVSNGGVTPANQTYRYYGNSIRCIAK